VYSITDGWTDKQTTDSIMPYCIQCDQLKRMFIILSHEGRCGEVRA